MKTILFFLIFIGFVVQGNSQNQKSVYQKKTNQGNMNNPVKKENICLDKNKHDYKENKQVIRNNQYQSKINDVINGKIKENTKSINNYEFTKQQYQNTCNTNIFSNSIFSIYHPNSLELFARSHHFVSLRFDRMIERWFLLVAILNSFEITATLKDWDFTKDDKSGIFLFDIVNCPEREPLPSQILVTLQKPTLYKDGFFIKNKTYTFFITKYKALAWQSKESSKFDKNKLFSYFGFIIENKLENENTVSSK